MRTRRILGAIATISLIATACTGSATPSPTTSAAVPTASAPASQPATSASAPASVEASASPVPSGPTPIASIGAGEGELDIVVWPGYAEDGSNVKEYDWVHPFEAANPDCATVNVKPADTSDDMYTLMTQNHGLYDGVSASGDASNRLIDAGEISAIDPTMFPDYKDIAQFLKSPPHNTVNGVHYGVSHGWGGNTLMYRSDLVKPAPTSWDIVFDPTAAAAFGSIGNGTTRARNAAESANSTIDLARSFNAGISALIQRVCREQGDLCSGDRATRAVADRHADGGLRTRSKLGGARFDRDREAPAFRRDLEQDV